MSRPGQPGWVGFRYLVSRSPLFSPTKKKIFSNEKPGCPGYRDLGIRDRDLGNGDENCSI